MSVEIRRMWEGGPLRQCSIEHGGPCQRFYQSPLWSGYTGAYVCDECQRAVDGVYLVHRAGKWLGGACKSTRRIAPGEKHSHAMRVEQQEA